MNLIGKMIGNRYEILKEVGAGGMATVYKAKDHVLKRNVAVKVLRDEYTTDTDFIRRFNSEAEAAANLQHPNIVSVYDVGHEEESNLYYIVMELIKGKTLKDIINKDGVLSWKWAINIAIQIAAALELAHKNGLIHRDIKPHNIIITEDGVAKVTDFGIAKAVSNSTITAFGKTIGSVHYFSPEQAKGGITDEKSDLYSLGVVMYEMLTGRVPFDADTPVSIALKHMQEPPKQPIEWNDEIPSAVNDIVMKAMQKDPIDRYQNATEMLADLSEALKDPDGDFVIIENKDGGYTRIINAVPEDAVDRGNRKQEKQGFFKKHPKMKIVVIILALILLFAGVFFGTKIALDGDFEAKVDLPNLTGKTQDEAKKIMEELNLTLEVGDPQASSTVEEGKIISQEPPYKEGEKLKKGSKIKIVLSKGPETNDLPDFTGEKIEDVRKKAKELGLELEETEENSSKVEEGKVISQDISAKTKVKSGDKVKVVVSKGTKKSTVPTVVDMDEGTAKATLSNANLKANITYESDESKADGKVISQSVSQGKEVTEWTTIDLVVNKIEKKKESNVTMKLNVKIASALRSVAGTADNPSSVNATVSIIVNGNTQISKKSITIDLTKSQDEFNLGAIKGNESASITAEISINGKTDNKTVVENLDDYNGNSLIIDYNLNSIK